MNMVQFWGSMFDIMLQSISMLNRVTLNNGVASVGFFTIMIGFTIFRIIVSNYV